MFSGGQGHGKGTEASAIEESTFQASDISVNGISLKGMTRSEAKAAIEKEYPWKVTITYNGESIDAENLIDTDLDAFLDGICTGKAEGEYTFAVEDSEDLQSAAAEAAADAAAKWDVKAKNGSISEYDAATDKFLFADGAPGKAVNQEKRGDNEDAVSVAVFFYKIRDFRTKKVAYTLALQMLDIGAQDDGLWETNAADQEDNKPLY